MILNGKRVLAVRFGEEAKRKYSRGSLIKKVNARESGAEIEILDAATVDKINNRVLVSIKQHEIERNSGLELAAKIYTH